MVSTGLYLCICKSFFLCGQAKTAAEAFELLSEMWDKQSEGKIDPLPEEIDENYDNKSPYL